MITDSQEAVEAFEDENPQYIDEVYAEELYTTGLHCWHIKTKEGDMMLGVVYTDGTVVAY